MVDGITPAIGFVELDGLQDEGLAPRLSIGMAVSMIASVRKISGRRLRL